MRTLITALAIATFATIANAQHKHGNKGPNGGPMEDIAGVHAELVTASNIITINVLDEDSKAVSTKGYSGSVLIVTGTTRETVTLTPSGENALKGETKSPITGTSNITLVLKTETGKSGQVRFKR